MYQVKRPSRSSSIPVRNLDYHVLSWGQPQSGTVPLVLLHGWMDIAASFQFVVDVLSEAFVAQRQIIAPDWRGFGLTQTKDADNFWFPDYLADLDFLLDHFAWEQPVDLLGHSMGGNVAMLYAGIRPERIRRLINLEGFGLPATQAGQAPGRYARWMNDLKQLQRGELALKTYDSVLGVAQRLMKTNPRLSADKAQWLARFWSSENLQGQWEIRGHAAHKVSSAQLYRVDETLEIYQRISAPTLSVVAENNQMAQWWGGKYSLAEYQQRIARVPQVQHAEIADAGHMLQHDQPEALARLIEDFLSPAPG